MPISEIATWVFIGLSALYFLNQLYITVKALRWRSQDKLIARALERRDV